MSRVLALTGFGRNLSGGQISVPVSPTLNTVPVSPTLNTVPVSPTRTTFCDVGYVILDTYSDPMLYPDVDP